MLLTSVLTTLLISGLAVAAPSKLQERRHERLQKRLSERRSLRPLAVNATSMEEFISVSAPSEVTYSSNWAGAVIVSSGITSVTGTFTIPTAKEPSGGSSRTEYGAAAWVGIDGDTCGSGKSSHLILLQAAFLALSR